MQLLPHHDSDYLQNLIFNKEPETDSEIHCKSWFRVQINFSELYHKKLCKKISCFSVMLRATMFRSEGQNILKLYML